MTLEIVSKWGKFKSGLLYRRLEVKFKICEECLDLKLDPLGAPKEWGMMKNISRRWKFFAKILKFKMPPIKCA